MPSAPALASALGHDGNVPRAKAPHVTRRVPPGAVRSEEAGSALDVLLLAPGPDWAAVDVASGALVRGALSSYEHELPAALASPPLTSLRLVLAALTEPWDPARPEAVALESVASNRPPSRRAVRRLLDVIARSDDDAVMLGGLGPSLPFVELGGNRPSVAVVAPSGGRVRFTGESEVVAHFRVGQHVHAVPLVSGAAQWLKAGEIPTAASRAVGLDRRHRRSGAGQLGPGIEPTVPVLLVVGLGRPTAGQVRKVVLGVLPAP
jgi:hypothetical protein